MSLPDKMKAMVLTGHGGLDKLVWHEDWPRPQPNDDEVLIKVHACGLNNTDVNTRSGWYSKAVTEATTGDGYEEVHDEDPTWGGRAIQLPRIQGADAVGTVVSVGANADPSLVGKRVMTDGWLRDWNDPTNMDETGYFGSESDGGFAEYAKTHHRNVLPVESPLSDAELATFSCSYTTAENMLNRANVGPGDRVLIPGASGGVGSALIQLANRGKGLGQPGDGARICGFFPQNGAIGLGGVCGGALLQHLIGHIQRFVHGGARSAAAAHLGDLVDKGLHFGRGDVAHEAVNRLAVYKGEDGRDRLHA